MVVRLVLSKSSGGSRIVEGIEEDAKESKLGLGSLGRQFLTFQEAAVLGLIVKVTLALTITIVVICAKN